MAIERQGNRVSYVARRLWPGPRGAASALTVHRGDRIAASDVTPLEHFLTARWGLYTRLRDRLAFAPVDHPPWPLERASLESLDDELVPAAGYPKPNGEPLVHYSTGVEVRIGLPRRVNG
jgi:uncharacterized protein YqjF (DUF2071 family)